jgi:isoleucyl-tRNA synthetase
VPQGYATGAAKGLTTADLPDHAYWEKWFPADWVSEMREQIRLWFYSQLFMSVVLTGRAPFRQVLGYEKMLDETGREMHGSWGNMIEAEDAFARMGADVMRWQYCAQVPSQNLLFGFHAADEIKGKLLRLWNSVAFFVLYANIVSFRPSWAELEPGGDLRPLDRWLVERTHAFVKDAEASYEMFLANEVIRHFEAYLDDLSNWYIRRSRRRFWEGEREALETLWYALVQSLRVVAPLLPFVADHLWRNLVLDGPDSVHLAPWPEVAAADRALLDEITEVRRVVELARRARGEAGIKNRQPLRRLVVEGAREAQAHGAEIGEELNVKEVEFGAVQSALRVKPNLPVLGPRLGKELGAVRAALSAGEFEELPEGRFRVAGHDLEPDDVLVERTGRDGWAVASADGLAVALDLRLDAELLLEADALDLIRTVNVMRKDAGLEVTDRIVLTVPAAIAPLVERHGDRIKAEVLATEIRAGGGSEPSIAKAGAHP